jgi:hypothetical protein
MMAGGRQIRAKGGGMENGTPTEAPQEQRCAQCQTALAEGAERVATEDGVFCGICFSALKQQVQMAIQAQSQDVPYPMALIGAVLGGALGVLVWWGFTVLTEIAFGLVAVVIGFAVGKGILLLTGYKRALGLQVLSVAVAGLSFFYASYLVNRTFVLRAMAEQGEEILLPLLPMPDLLVNVIGLSFGLMDLVFLAIVLYQAWKIPAPLQLGD